MKLRNFFASLFENRYVIKNGPYALAIEELVNAEEKLVLQLNPAAKQDFEAYRACQDHVEQIDEAENFELGFRTGFRIALACLCGKSKNFKVFD